jgi:peptide/nickel transport system permease protein
MVRFVSRRVVWSLAMLVLVASIAFFAVNILLPYDYAVGVGRRPTAVAEIREHLGLDRPIWIRWLDYLWHLMRGDLGESYGGQLGDDFGNQRVSSLLWRALPATVTIFAVGGIVAYLLGEWFGRRIAWSRSRVFRTAGSTGSVLMFTAFPPWLAFLLVYFGMERVFQVRSAFGLGPKALSPVPEGPLLVVLAGGLLLAFAGGVLLRNRARKRDHRVAAVVAVPAFIAVFLAVLPIAGVWSEAIDRLLWPSAVMATLALVLIATGENMLVMRAGVSAEMAEDYVFTARAKGVPERLIRDRHIAPNAVIPAIARLITSVPYLIAGLIIIERELRLDGIASLFFEAIEAADVPIIVGILVGVGLIGLVLRIVMDMVQAQIDPRLRTEGRAV